MIVGSQRTREAWTFPLAFAGGLCAFGAGTALVMVGSDCSESCLQAGSVADVAGGYGYLAWAAFVGLTFAVGLWAAWTLSAPAIQVRRSLRDCVSDAVTATVMVLVLAIGILPTASMSADAYPDCICGWHLRVIAVFTIGMVLAIPGIVLLDRLRQVASCRACQTRLTLAQFLNLRRQLDHCVLVLGGYFTVALLTAGALRLAVIDGGEAFAPVRLILAGVQFTALLMILYWPAQAALNGLARAWRDAARPLPDLSDPAFRATAEARSAIDGALGVTSTPVSGFLAQTAVLAPLLSSLFASLVGTS